MSPPRGGPRPGVVPAPRCSPALGERQTRAAAAGPCGGAGTALPRAATPWVGGPPAAPSLPPRAPHRSPQRAMQSLNITAERLSRLLRDHNLTRQRFIALYGLRPLVHTPRLPGRAQLALALAGGLIFLLALVGNALVLCAVARGKATRSVTNVFIGSLALSDLLIAFFCIPVTTLQNVSDTWLGGECAPGFRGPPRPARRPSPPSKAAGAFTTCSPKRTGRWSSPPPP